MVSEDRYGFYLNAMVGKAELSDIEVLGIQCEQPYYCCINCRLVYDAKGRKEERNLRDCWVKVGNAWSHVLKNPMIFPQLGMGGAGRTAVAGTESRWSKKVGL